MDTAKYCDNFLILSQRLSLCIITFYLSIVSINRVHLCFIEDCVCVWNLFCLGCKDVSVQIRVMRCLFFINLILDGDVHYTSTPFIYLTNTVFSNRGT